MFKKSLMALLSLGLGLGLGLGLAVAYGRTATADAPVDIEGDGSKDESPARDQSVSPAFIRQLVRSELSASQSKGSPSHGTEAGEHVADDFPVQETFDEVQQRVANEVAEYRGWFDGEVADRSWAPGAEESLTTSLMQIPDASFELRHLTCKTSVCMGEIEWDDAATAVQEVRKVAEHPYEKNCTTSVFLPDLKEHGNEGKVTAQVVFDCTELRAGTL